MRYIEMGNHVVGRVGDWMQTYSGGMFFPFDPRVEEIHIEDIAHHLATLNRFGGAAREPYSVAEHCVRVSYTVPAGQELWGLLHDASEAYLVDLPRPIKRSPPSSSLGPEYLKVEDRIMAAICDRFQLSREMPLSVKDADCVLLMTEARDLMAKPPVTWKESGYQPLEAKIEPWDWIKAKAMFMARFYDLTEDRKHLR